MFLFLSPSLSKSSEQKVELIETESRMVVTRDWGDGGTRGMLVKGYKILIMRGINSDDLITEW